jgi:hypothetical protein
MLSEGKKDKKTNNSMTKSIFSQNKDQAKEKSNAEFESIKGKVIQGNHKRRVSKDSDFYMISDSSEQNRSKVNWYSIMNSEKSLITDGEKSQRQKASKSVKSGFTAEELPQKNEYRGSLRLVQSPIAFEEDEIFGEISRKISKITGSEKSISRIRNLSDVGELITESQKSMAFEKKLETEMDFIGKESNRKDSEETEQVNLVTEFNSIFNQLETMESKHDLHKEEKMKEIDRRNSLACRKELEMDYKMKKKEEEFMWSMRDNIIMEVQRKKSKTNKFKTKGGGKKTRKTKTKKSKVKQLKNALVESKVQGNFRATLSRNELKEIRANQNKGQKYIQDLILGKGNKKKKKSVTGSVKSMGMKIPKSSISSKKMSIQTCKDNKSERIISSKELDDYKSSQTPSRKMNFLKKKNVSYVGNKTESAKRKSKSKDKKKRENKSQKSKKSKKSSAKWVNGELIHNVDSIIGDTLNAMDFNWINKPKAQSKVKKRKKSTSRGIKTVAQNTISSIGTIESNLVFGKGQANFEDLYTLNQNIVKSKRKNKTQQSLNENELDQFIQNRIVEDININNPKSKRTSFTSKSFF